MSKTLKRDLIAVIWTLLVTYAIGKWAFHLAISREDTRLSEVSIY